MGFDISMMTPECELEIELVYRACLRCEDREGCKYGELVIDYWEDHQTKKYHRKLKENGVLDIRRV